VLGTVTTLGLWIQWTQYSHDNGMAEEFGTLTAEFRTFQYLCGYFGVIKFKRLPQAVSVMFVTVHG